MAASPSSPTSSPPIAGVESSGELLARLRRVRRRHGAVALATGFGMLLTALCAWLVAECATDFARNLSWMERLAALIAGWGLALFSFIQFGIRPWRRPMTDETVALMVERALPVFRSRFIAAVQLARATDGGASPGLIKALLAETTALAATADFSGVIDTRRCRVWLQRAALALFITGALTIWAGPKARPLALRALLSRTPVPRKTLILNVRAPAVIAVGDSWTVSAVAVGIVPAAGSLELKSASGRRQEFPFQPEKDAPASFSRTLQSVQESFEYRLALGDAETDSVRVRVEPRPAVAGVECRQFFPAYTRLPSRPRPLGDLKILAGSRLALKVRATSTVRSGEIRLLTADHEKVLKSSPLIRDPKDGARLSGEIELRAKEIGGLMLQLTDEDGIESRGTAIYPVEILPDTPPTIKVLWPERREELLTREATMLLSFNARDDFGVARIRLHFAVGWVEGAPDKAIDLDIGAGEASKDLTRRFNWRIGQITPHVEEGSVIDYWFEALDANDISGPGVGATEHMQARIVSEAEKRADLANRLNDAMEGLNGVKQGQEDVSQKLGEIIFEKPTGKP